MANPYTRQSSFSDGDTVTSALFNDEYDQLVLSFSSTVGHTHDGSTGEGAPITKLSIKPEGSTDINLDVRYDFEDAKIQQPSTFSVGSILEPSLFGVAEFGIAKFGAPEVPMKRINLLGSGFSNSFKFTSNDINPPYSIQGMYVDLIPASRR